MCTYTNVKCTKSLIMQYLFEGTQRKCKLLDKCIMPAHNHLRVSAGTSHLDLLEIWGAGSIFVYPTFALFNIVCKIRRKYLQILCCHGWKILSQFPSNRIFFINLGTGRPFEHSYRSCFLQ